MKFLLRSWAIIVVAIKRLLAQRWLALSIVVGLITSIALVMSIPLYADAVYYQILQDELTGTDPTSTIQRPPFAYMFRYVGSTYGAKEWEEVVPVDTYLSNQAAGELGLPHGRTVRHMKTDNVRLFPADTTAYSDTTDPLEWVSFGFISEIQDHIRLLEGTFPAVGQPGDEAPLEILVSQRMADELGIQAGEAFMTFRRTRTESSIQTVQIPVVVSGIWQAVDPGEAYWFYNEGTLSSVLIIPEESYINRIAPAFYNDVYLALWYLIMDGSEVTASDVGRLLRNTTQVEQWSANLLADTRLGVSPTDALRRYQRSSGLLTTLLYAFSIPIIGLLLAFIGLVVGLSVARQRNEVAVLRSRGATIGQVLGISTLEASALGLLALAVAIPASFWVANLIGATRSFLDFTVESNLRLVLSQNTLRTGFAAVGMTLLAQLAPTLGASRHTIVTYKQEQARTMQAPWWQRAFLDVMLLIPAFYGIYLLRQQGSLTLPGQTGGQTLFDNPLLFLVPALGIFAMTLVTLRFLPLFMSLLAWIASKRNGVGFLLATRHLSRNRGLYTAPMVLLVLTLSLSAFTTSLAQTLDNHLYDQIYYQIGADGRLNELGSAPSSGVELPGTDGASTGAEVVNWSFVPVTEHLRVPEIEAAARVAEFEAGVQLQGSWETVNFIGIDRLDFPKATFWRRDFAAASLGSLMNSLALGADGVLLNRSFMQAQTIRVGDIIRVRASRYGLRAEMSMTVVGDFRYFPGWYPEDGPLIVGNLDNLFEQMGGQFPYDVLIKTAPGTDYAQMAKDLRVYDLNVVDSHSARQLVALRQKLPERQGLFGVLSVGFLAAAVLTVLGFLLYTLFSFRRRFIELGTLRAIGLSSGQMTFFLAWELAFLILVGIGVGTVLGAVMSDIFIPYLQIGTNPADLTPPFLVGIAWPAIFRIYALFGFLFVIALSVLVTLLMRMRIFQAIKLGETV